MMSKDYICKTCMHNNHGWCDKLKKQGLSKIFECKDYSELNSCSEVVDNYKEEFGLRSTNSKDLEQIFQIGKMLGSRELLLNIQKQVLSLKKQNKTLSNDDWFGLLQAIEHSLSQTEMINNVSVDDLNYETDRMIYNATKQI